MFRTSVNATPNSREMISTFYGYNHNIRQEIGELWDSKNITLDNYPCLSTKDFVEQYKSLNDVLGYDITIEATCIIDNKYLMAMYRVGDDVKAICGTQIFDIASNAEEATQKPCLVKLGNKVLAFPYNVSIERKTNGQFEVNKLGTSCNLTGGTIYNCALDGTTYKRVYVGDDKPVGQYVGGYVAAYSGDSSVKPSDFSIYKMEKNGELSLYADYAGNGGHTLLKFVNDEQYESLSVGNGDVVLDGTQIKKQLWAGYRQGKYYLNGNGGYQSLDDIVIDSKSIIYAYWIDTTDSANPIFKMYSSASESWVASTDCYCKIKINTNDSIKAGDTVKLVDTSGDNPLVNSDRYKERYYIYKKKNNYIYIKETIFNGSNCYMSSSSDWKIEKDIPKFDYVTVAGNYVWGCYYGKAVQKNKQGENETVMLNQIYACSMGDPTNWYSFANEDAGSFQGTLSNDGEFTGAFSLNNNPYFFKENAIFTIYGSYPSQFQVNTIEREGCKAGNSKSIAVVDGYVFYKSPNGICVFDGSSVVNISSPLGTIKYNDVVAGGSVGKYYASMNDEYWNTSTFIYDIRNQMWVKLNEVRYNDFACSASGIVIAMDNEEYWTVLSDDEIVFPSRPGVVSKMNESDWNNAPNGLEEYYARHNSDYNEWMAETGAIDYSYPDNKGISNVRIRAIVELGATLSIYIKYDSNGEWLHIGDLIGNGTPKTSVFTIIPVSCDHYAYKFEGTGKSTIISIANNIEIEGSDI